MTSNDPSPQGAGSPQKSQAASGPKSGTTAQVVREADMMRAGVDGVLIAISPSLVSLRVGEELQVDEQLKIRLKNVVQRCEKDVRGVVRKATRCADGTMTIDIDLFTRLTPIEVSMLRMGVAKDENAGPRWV